MSSESACPIILPAYLSDTAPLDNLLSLVHGRKTSLADYPLASSIAQDLIPVYDAPALRKSGHLTSNWTDAACLPLKEEFIRALKLGPGVVIFKKAWDDKELMAKSTGVLQTLIDEQRAIDTCVRNENYIVSNTSGKWANKGLIKILPARLHGLTDITQTQSRSPSIIRTMSLLSSRLPG